MTLVLVAAIPAVLVLAPTASDATPVPALVRASSSELAGFRGVEILETYDAFSLVRASPDRLSALQQRGLPVEVQEESYWIGLDAVRFDVRAGEPEVAPGLRADVTAERGLYIVHFLGPVKAEWLRDLQRTGARVLHSLPTQAFLVEMDGAARAAVRSHRAVDFVGAYHPAYKIHPDLAAKTGPRLVQIVTVDADDVRGVTQLLRDADLPELRFDSEEAGILSVFTVGDLGVVRARLDAGLIPAIARQSSVLLIEPYSAPVLLNWGAQAVLQTGRPPSDPDATSRRLWVSGLRGAGQIITPADTGLDFDHNFFRESAGVIQKGDPGDPTGTIGPLSIYNTTDFTRRKLVRYIPMSPYRNIDPWTGGDPETVKDAFPGHGTFVAGNAAGNDAGLGTLLYDGMAIDAKLILEDIGSGMSLAFIPDNYDDMFGPAFTNGSRIHTNSWGAAENGYDLQAMMVDRFVWNHPDMAVFFAAGNDGPGSFTVGSPGTAKSAVTMGGALEYPSQEFLETGSGRGPTADGRMKPEVVTFFWGTSVPSSGNPRDNANIDITGGFGGTSHSTPQGAGMGALVRQYYVDGFYPSGTAVPANGFEPSAALVKATLAVGSRKMTHISADAGNTYPNHAQGWGRVTLDDALYINPSSEGLRKLWVVDHRAGLATGQAVDYKIDVGSGSTALRIVLAWSDYWALPNANPALMNNLNLQVTSPTGAVYKGNVFGTFAAAESVANSGSPDTLNPVEGVIVNAPAVGEWTLHVEALNVPSGPQAFSIVAAGDLNLGYGDIRLDKTVYDESDTVSIEVRDANAATVSVEVRSTLETAGETVALGETAPGSGVWRGAINTAFGDPVADGVLQVNEGGSIEAIYTDLNPSHVATARASVDASPPAISNVRAEDITNAAATIRWTTNEAANSRVYYGTDNVTLPFTAFDSGLVTSHGVQLVQLATDVQYYYDVESADGLGHTTRDDNGGDHYTFRTSDQGEILLVIGEESFEADGVAAYRSGLQGSAWTFNEWNVPLSGNPPLAVLQQYKVVIWQPGLEQYPPLTDAQRVLVKAYLDAGGRLFLSSHDITWAACSTVQNPYYSAERCSWVRSVLKTWWQVDPATWPRNTGLAGDPISNPYTGGVNYVGSRSGGYGDEVDNLCRTGAACTMAGATTTYVWRAQGGDSTNDHIAVKFESTASNGTLGTGVWGGTPTKVVAFYFEWSRVNFVVGQSSDPARTDILNRTIVWLIGRDHPAVLVKSPNGGETITGNTVTIQWIRNSFGGTNVASQRLYYSDDSGQSWNFIGTTPSPADTSYVWDVSSLPNGGKYRVRVIAQDDGTPSLAGNDASDGDFAINRTGGDTRGPLIWPGSVSIVPNPIVTGSLVTFRATADDRARGNSLVTRAELFEGATEPLPVDYSNGIPMNPSDTGWDETLEDVVWTSAAPWPAGSSCFWVHAMDAADNWGPFESRCTVIASTFGADPDPPELTMMTGTALVGGGDDVLIGWQRSPDEGQIGGTVAYRVMRSTTLGGPYAQASPDVPGSGSSSYGYIDVGAGDPAPSLTYFYFIRTVDQAGNTGNGTDRAAKLSWDLPAGVSAVSYPLVLSDTSLLGVFQTSPPRGAWTYDAATENWLTYSSSRPAGQNSLRTVTRMQGVYVDLAAADRFTVAGLIPALTTINLASGWNLISFPSFLAKTAAQALFEMQATTILAYDPAAPPGYTRVMAGGEVLQPGRAYWVLTALPVGWSLRGA